MASRVKNWYASFGVDAAPVPLMRRLDRSRQLIGQNESLAAIAADCGFADHGHFSRTFNAAYGITPGQYRDALCVAVDRNA